jgi:cytochrome P450
MIDVIEKRNYIVDDITVLTQKLTLDILGKTIFDHEFNSLKGSIQQDLSAYHILMNNMLSLFYNLFFPLTYIPFLPHNKRVTGAQKVLDDLCYRLIEESKKKKVPTSMLDYIVRATEHENGITLKELRDNIVLFFVAGHEVRIKFYN